MELNNFHGVFSMKKYWQERNSPDLLLVIPVLLLLVVGLVMVYSASSIWAAYKFDDSFFFVKRQALFAGVGLIGAFVLSKLEYQTWRKYSKVIIILSFLLLIAVLIPGVGMVRNGSRSWIGIGAFSIQPSEFMKLAMIIFLSAYIEKRQKVMNSLVKGLVPTLGIVILAFGIIMLQPDLGTGTVLLGTSLVIIFVSGARIFHFVCMGLVGVAGFVGLVISAPYRLARITSYLDPWSDPLGTGFQIIQSLYAIGPGGLFGLGFGASRQKYFYLPEPQTDFIFAIISEELGFIGAAIVIVLFAIILWRGIRVSLRAPDMFGSLVALGIVAMITIQVMINVSVVSGLIPVTGITLPFLSYGGSSLTLTLLAVGILLNISKQATK